MYLAAFLTILLFPLWDGIVSPLVAVTVGPLLLVPGGIDGLTQMFASRESTNNLRAVTGFGLGIGTVLSSYGVVGLLAVVFL